jgi:hypothetical protein
MANYNYGHSFPRVFVGTGALATSGKTANLKAGQIGIFDKGTFQAINPAVALPAAQLKRQILFAQGSYHTKDSLTSGNPTDMFQGLQKSVKTVGILPKYINRIEKTSPQRPVSESWIIGWDGFSTCSATPKCDSVYTVRVEGKGTAIRRLLNRDWYKELTHKTECCDGCATCGEDGNTSKLAMFNDFAKQINEDPIAKNFLKASLVYSKADCPILSQYYYEFTVDIADAGDVLSLAKLQVEYPTYDITRIQRDGVDVTNNYDQTKGAVSTYQVFLPAAPTTTLGSTVATAADVNPAVVDTRYEVDASAAVEITLPASSPGDVIEVVSTAGDVTNITFAGATLAGTTAVPATGVLVIEDDGAGAWTGSVLDVTPADTANGESWTQGATMFRAVDTRFITINKEEGDAVGRLAEVQTYYSDRDDILSISQSTDFPLVASDCTQVLELKIVSNNLLEEGCKASDVATYDKITAFETVEWQENIPCTETADCDTQIGLKIETAFVDKKFGDCSFSCDDFYNLDGIRLSVTLKDDAALCSKEEWPVRKLTSFVQATGLGETVLRKYITAAGYDLPEEIFEYDPRWREATDQQFLNVVNRSAYYKRYTINHTVPYTSRSMGMIGLNNDHTYNIDFFFEENTDTADFEARLVELAVEAGVDEGGALVSY